MFERIDPWQLARALAAREPLLLLDVRQPWEHERARLPGSLLIPLDELPERLDEIRPPEGARVVAYCHHGVRSLSAAALLAQHGFARVASLDGGLEAWSCTIDPQVPRY